MEVGDIVQEAVIKIILNKKKCKKAKWLSEEALQIAEKRREATGKEERKDIPINAEFQRIARRDKKKPSSMINAKKERKTIEWERLEISSRKLEIPSEPFHAKMGSKKDRNGMDLTEAEDIKRRWQEYTEEVYKKDLHEPNNHPDHSPKARHPEMQSQVGLRKHYYEQS